MTDDAKTLKKVSRYVNSEIRKCWKYHRQLRQRESELPYDDEERKDIMYQIELNFKELQIYRAIRQMIKKEKE